MKTSTSGVAVVTGGGSGIGAATCLRLARDGYAVAVWDRNLRGAQETAAQIERNGGMAMAVLVDVADPESVNRAAAATRERLGLVSALVNSAGIRDLIPFFDIKPADWHKVVDVCLSGPFYCTQALASDMKERGGGSIVNVSSIAGLASRPDRTAYVAAKTGLVGLTRSNAEALGPSGIRVNSVAPGWITTPLQAVSATRPESQNLEGKIPLRRIGKPEDIADVVSFFCSDASRYVTGTTLPVDGGRLIVY
jgi:NAD(P)-dependent dehydrogenase (short-subunit alcohol dehydrogenase family)